MDYAIAKARADATRLIARAAGASAVLEEPKNPEFGIVSWPVFAHSKQAGRNPIEFAKETAQAIAKLLPDAFFQSVRADGGYVNLVPSDLFFITATTQANEKGFGSDSKTGTTVIDYSSPNVGKPMHIGHIRSTILGDAVKKVLAFRGKKAMGENYLCEAGTQVATLMAGLGSETEAVGDDKDLARVYVKASAAVEADPKLKEEVLDIVRKMEDGDKSISTRLERVRALSIPPFEKNYGVLGVTFESSVFDSDYIQAGKAIVQEAVEKGFAFKDKNGETVAKLEGEGLPNLIILRSNGTTLYSTRDLGLAEERWRRHAFSGCIYVTASEQNTHFKQVFKLLELLGREYAARLRHIGFGLVFLQGGMKLSTRKGRVLLLEDVLEEAVAAARKEIDARNLQYDEEEKNSIARTVGIGSLKFAFLRVGAEKNIIFNPEEAVKFDGDTGAYVQYTCVRARNILRKAGASGERPGAIPIPQESRFDPVERRLGQLLATFPDAVASAERGLQPHVLCDHALKTSAAFSEFYEKNQVLNAEGTDREKRLALVAATANVLETELALLGISVPERM